MNHELELDSPLLRPTSGRGQSHTPVHVTGKCAASCPKSRQGIASQRNDTICQSRTCSISSDHVAGAREQRRSYAKWFRSLGSVGPLRHAAVLATYPKFPEQAVTSVSGNSGQDDHSGARYHGQGNKGCDERHGSDRLSRKPRRHTAIGAFLCSAITKSGGIVIAYSLPDSGDSGNRAKPTF